MGLLKQGGSVIVDLWQKLKKDYIKGGISYRQLAAKYGVSESTLRKRGMAEKWGDIKNRVGTKTEQKLVEKVSEQNAEIDATVFDAAMLLLNAYMKSVKAFLGEKTVIPPSMLKDYGTAIKSIQSVLDRPTELDIKEQEARIAKLWKDAEKDNNTPTDITVIIEGGAKEYSE